MCFVGLGNLLNRFIWLAHCLDVFVFFSPLHWLTFLEFFLSRHSGRQRDHNSNGCCRSPEDGDKICARRKSSSRFYFVSFVFSHPEPRRQSQHKAHDGNHRAKTKHGAKWKKKYNAMQRATRWHGRHDGKCSAWLLHGKHKIARKAIKWNTKHEVGDDEKEDGSRKCTRKKTRARHYGF